MSQDNLIKLQCSECKHINYHSKRNKKTLKNKIQLEKYCRHCKKHQLHKEAK